VSAWASESSFEPVRLMKPSQVGQKSGSRAAFPLPSRTRSCLPALAQEVVRSDRPMVVCCHAWGPRTKFALTRVALSTCRAEKQFLSHWIIACFNRLCDFTAVAPVGLYHNGDPASEPFLDIEDDPFYGFCAAAIFLVIPVALLAIYVRFKGKPGYELVIR